MESLINGILGILSSYDSVDDSGNNILHFLSQYGDLELLRKIIKKNDIPLKSLINKRNDDGDTPLHLAVRSGNQKVASYLIKKGADSSICNFKGETCVLKNSLKVEGEMSGGGNKSDIYYGSRRI